MNKRLFDIQLQASHERERTDKTLRFSPSLKAKTLMVKSINQEKKEKDNDETHKKPKRLCAIM